MPIVIVMHYKVCEILVKLERQRMRLNALKNYKVCEILVKLKQDEFVDVEFRVCEIPVKPELIAKMCMMSIAIMMAHYGMTQLRLVLLTKK